MSKQSKEKKKKRSSHAAHEQRLQDESKDQLEKSETENDIFYSLINKWIEEEGDDVFAEIEVSLRKIKKIHQKLQEIQRKIEYHQKMQEKPEQ